MTFIESFAAPAGATGHPRSIRMAAVVGSTRRGSLNAALLRTARAVAPEGMTIEAIPIDEIPFYDGDVETDGDPAAVARLKRAIGEADGLIVVTPEYNRSLPAILKNAIDWASRGPALRGKPVLLMGASSGRSGAKHALDHAAAVLAHTGAIPFEHRVEVPSASSLADDRVRADGELQAELAEVLRAFRDWVGAAERRSIGLAA